MPLWSDTDTFFLLFGGKINGNRTFVGSECIRNIDPKAAAVIEVQGFYKGQDNKGLQTFTVKAATTLVQRLHVVEHLSPPLIKNLDGRCQVSVMYPKAESLLVGKAYSLRLKAKYVRDQLTLTAL